MARTNSVFPPPFQALQQIVRTALAEDLSGGDITSNLIIDDSFQAHARITAKQPLVVAGILVAQETFRQVDPTLQVTIYQKDGQWMPKAGTVMTISGQARSLLKGERVALNFLQRLSGISTLTHRCCQAIKGSSPILTDTRKTTPGLRILEKWAVRLGGGHNHRSALHDGILIKDNHLAILDAHHIGITQACLRAKAHAPHGLKICVEVENLKQVNQAILGKADIILLDNMSPTQVRQAIAKIKGRAITEVSGGITLDNLRDMAHAQPDYISMGVLTHSAPSMDFTMEISPPSHKRRPANLKRASTR
ncbi:MAG: carboxylating nicotinate-nucleotide diphosphorylase [Nitrospirales bacterium]|nr:carboxylating nicotinate-nucleotide diphosphorylase [Nitrospirales bacterium]